MRRDFKLLSEDTQFLDDYGCPWETITDGSQWVLLNGFTVPAGYNLTETVAAIRLETGYPVAQLDMVYFNPPLSRCDSKPIAATNATQQINGATYQRWSRHRTAQNPWIPGQDSLGTHVMLIEDWLDREFK